MEARLLCCVLPPAGDGRGAGVEGQPGVNHSVLVCPVKHGIIVSETLTTDLDHDIKEPTNKNKP